MTYDSWKTTNPADEFMGPEPPPCERPVKQGYQHLHPRYPSGDCIACGALCTESCKHEDFKPWEVEQTDDGRESEANARLIAAAPELLAALQAIVETFVCLQTASFCEACGRHAPTSRQGKVVGAVAHADDCPLIKARATIARATGGARS